MTSIPIGTKRLHLRRMWRRFVPAGILFILIGMTGCRLLGQQPTITAAVPDLLPELNRLEARLLVDAARVRYWEDLHNLKEASAHRLWMVSFARERHERWGTEQVAGRSHTVSRKKKALAFR